MTTECDDSVLSSIEVSNNKASIGRDENSRKGELSYEE